MHTLTATPSGMLYLTTSDGYLRINPKTGEQEAHRQLLLPDGSVLSTGINTVRLDREGGIWLGTYNSGVLYTSPLSGLFDTQPIDIEVYPILTAIYLHGQPLQVDKEYDGRRLLDVTPPYAERLSFRHNQNSLAFQFSTMNPYSHLSLFPGPVYIPKAQSSPDEKRPNITVFRKVKSWGLHTIKFIMLNTNSILCFHTILDNNMLFSDSRILQSHPPVWKGSKP